MKQGLVYQSQTQIAATLDASGNIVSRFVYGSKANVPDFMIRGGATYTMISDARGSARIVVNSTTGKAVQLLGDICVPVVDSCPIENSDATSAKTGFAMLIMHT